MVLSGPYVSLLRPFWVGNVLILSKNNNFNQTGITDILYIENKGKKFKAVSRGKTNIQNNKDKTVLT